MEISGKTRLVAILGHPVAHSLSPAMHNAAFRELGLPYAYVPCPVGPKDVGAAVNGLRALGFVGANVTVPHKEAVSRHLDEMSPTARAIGAVNTIVRDGDRLVGDNTDAPGFLAALKELGFRPRGKTALVLGAGGSARAVVHALASADAGRLILVNRTVARTAELARIADEAARYAPVRSGARGRTATRADPTSPVVIDRGPWDLARDPEVVGEVDLVVQTTSIGLDGKTAPGIAWGALPRHTAVVDLVYSPKETPFIRQARRKGFVSADGRGMLLHQAALSFRLWTGRRAPLETMRRALGAP